MLIELLGGAWNPLSSIVLGSTVRFNALRLALLMALFSLTFLNTVFKASFSRSSSA